MPGRTVRLVAAAVLFCVLFPALALAQSPFDIRIVDVDRWVNEGVVEQLKVVDLGTVDSVGVWVDPASGPGTPIGGFELLLSYPSVAMSFLDAKPGPDLHANWEYFTWRTGSQAGDTCAACPDRLIRLIGFTDLPGGGTPPDAAFNLAGCIATVTFAATGNIAYEGCYPVGFCTSDCTDNSIGSRTGNTLYVPSSGTNLCPGYSVDACTTGTAGAIVAYADFHEGTWCVARPPSDHGDINLNGIPNEVGDAVLFSHFLSYGWDVFDPAFETLQFLNSEINCDGAAGTTLDFVYLTGIITGDFQPIISCADPNLPPDSTWPQPTPSPIDSLRILNQFGMAGDTIAIDIYLRNVDTVGAFDFRLRYDPAVITPVTEPTPAYGNVYPVTSLLLRGNGILDFANGAVIEPGVMTYEAADFDHSGPAFLLGSGPTVRTYWHILPGVTDTVTAIAFENDPDWPQTYNTIANLGANVWKRPTLVRGLVRIIPDGCACPTQSDFDFSGFVDPLDLNELIDIVFGFSSPIGPNPNCPNEQSDFNADGFTDPVDLNAMIDYLFYKGPPPCNPCNPVQGSCR